ncbi:hypothetical protein PoB_000236500 [Plakobranchus ocellatus]|uniref:Uncharacterized protein n=1 Tax=Plakobranchus ocellatus TaxID=259542 RepID=A0AAV3XYF0_9GAST|nr:hypothetical protein PoB_000236500 [Plakobranchus ocellatus]
MLTLESFWGRVVLACYTGPGQFFISLLYSSSTKGVGKVKAARKAMANYLIMPYAKNNQDPTPSSPMPGLRVRKLYFYHQR